MKRISGITYLKAFLPLLVISCHILPFGDSSYKSLPFPKIPGAKDIFYSNICYLAVPLFFIISIFLYLKKRDRTKNHTELCIKRVCYLLGVFVFVRVIYVFFNIGNLWVNGRGLFKNFFALAFGGGDTLLYYLELCAYFIVLTELCCLFIEKVKMNKSVFTITGFVLSVFIITTLYFVPNETLKTELLIFYSPFCFLPYIFVAVFMKEREETTHISLYIAFLLLSIVFAVFEWTYIPDPLFTEKGYSIAFPSYARVSVILLSLAIFGLMLKIKRTPSKFTEYLASLSLYVYCLHQIFINYITVYIHDPFVGYLLVVAVTYLASVVIKFVVSTVKSHFAR